jgi:mutator protein MutT
LAVKPIDVAAGLVFHQQKLLITQRLEGSHLAGLWEFPGGKREPGETFEGCLVRELREELGIEVAFGQAFEEITHDYPGKTVHLKFFLCRLAKGEPRTIGCAAYEWATRESLLKRDFTPADERLLDRLVDTGALWR